MDGDSIEDMVIGGGREGTFRVSISRKYHQVCLDPEKGGDDKKPGWVHVLWFLNWGGVKAGPRRAP